MLRWRTQTPWSVRYKQVLLLTVFPLTGPEDNLGSTLPHRAALLHIYLGIGAHLDSAKGYWGPVSVIGPLRLQRGTQEHIHYFQFPVSKPNVASRVIVSLCSLCLSFLLSSAFSLNTPLKRNKLCLGWEPRHLTCKLVRGVEPWTVLLWGDNHQSTMSPPNSY